MPTVCVAECIAALGGGAESALCFTFGRPSHYRSLAAFYSQLSPAVPRMSHFASVC